MAWATVSSPGGTVQTYPANSGITPDGCSEEGKPLLRVTEKHSDKPDLSRAALVVVSDSPVHTKQRDTTRDRETVAISCAMTVFARNGQGLVAAAVELSACCQTAWMAAPAAAGLKVRCVLRVCGLSSAAESASEP